ncbi:hypothetical protein F5J12DRAFT_724743, partial [Pisolithus orientalis]|uniref:uncharacterized protein n=1 Tax=Pisolithus orientalis TaxID=936130 RepID=UPI002224A90C
KLILQAWEGYFKVMKQDLVASTPDVAGRISFTTNIWLSDSYHPYLALTAHWIAIEGGSLKMKVSLIAFQ